jgi:hypothetical protein
MLKPAKRQMTITIVENSARSGVPSQATGSSTMRALRRMSLSGPVSL